MNETIWLGFSSSKVRLKNPNDKWRQSHSFAFGFCEASIHKFVKAHHGCFKGSRQYILLCEQTTLQTNSKYDRIAEEIITHKLDKVI